MSEDVFWFRLTVWLGRATFTVLWFVIKWTAILLYSFGLSIAAWLTPKAVEGPRIPGVSTDRVERLED